MPTFPELQRLTVREGENVIVRARLTNSAGTRLVSDVQAGKQAVEITVRVFDRSSSTPTAVLLKQIIFGSNTGDNGFAAASYLQSNKTLTLSSEWTATFGGDYDVALAQNEIFVNETTAGERGMYNIATLPDADNVELSTDIGGDATVSGIFYTVNTVIPADAGAYLTEGWSRDSTGYNFLYALDPVVLGTSNQGGDWIPGHLYDFEARVTTDAVTAQGAQIEGVLWVRAQIQVEGLISV